MRARTLEELNQPMLRHTGTAYAKGMLNAAALASEYNSSSRHSHDLGDCILAKVNLLSHRSRIRRNPYVKSWVRRNPYVK